MPIPVVAADEALVQLAVARARCLTAAGHLHCVTMLLRLLHGPKRRTLSGLGRYVPGAGSLSALWRCCI